MIGNITLGGLVSLITTCGGHCGYFPRIPFIFLLLYSSHVIWKELVGDGAHGFQPWLPIKIT